MRGVYDLFITTSRCRPIWNQDVWKQGRQGLMGRRKRSAHGEVHPMEQQQPGAIKLVFWTGPRSPTSSAMVRSMDMSTQAIYTQHGTAHGGRRRSWQVERTATGVREGNASNLCHERVGPASLASLLQHFHAAKPSWADLGRAALAKFCSLPTSVLCSCLSVIRFPAGWLPGPPR